MNESPDATVHLPGALQQHVGAHHIGLGEFEGVLEGDVHVGLSGEVHHTVDLEFLHYKLDHVEVADVTFDEFEIRRVFDRL